MGRQTWRCDVITPVAQRVNYFTAKTPVKIEIGTQITRSHLPRTINLHQLNGNVAIYRMLSRIRLENKSDKIPQMYSSKYPNKITTKFVENVKSWFTFEQSIHTWECVVKCLGTDKSGVVEGFGRCLFWS